MRGPVPDGPKIGVLVPPHLPAGQLAGYARKAEQLGFAEVWVVEDCFLHGAFSQAAAILASASLLADRKEALQALRFSAASACGDLCPCQPG